MEDPVLDDAVQADPRDAEIASLKKQLADVIAQSDAKLAALENQRNQALNMAVNLEA